MTVATVTPNINAIVDQGQNMRVIKEEITFNFGHKCTTNESNANHLKSIFN